MSVFGPPHAPGETVTATLRFIDPPVYANGRWNWPGLDVRQTPVGMGLFATVAIAPGLLVPYVGELLTGEELERRNRWNARPGAPPTKPSRYILDDFDADPEEVPACKLGYCISAYANEAHTDRLYNCQFVQLANKKGTSSEEICKNMPPYHHFDTWGCFLGVCCAVEAGEELCVQYGSGYQPLRDYVPTAFTIQSLKDYAAYNAMLKVVTSVRTQRLSPPLQYTFTSAAAAAWDFESAWEMKDGSKRMFKGRIVGLRMPGWVETVYEDGERKMWQKSDIRKFNWLRVDKTLDEVIASFKP